MEVIDARERYMVVLMDGTSMMVLARNFREVLDTADVKDDEIWQMTKMDYKEIE